MSAGKARKPRKIEAPKPEAPTPINLADLRITLIEPVTGKRFGVWTGAELLNQVRVAHEVLDELRQYELKIAGDSERDFLLSSFLNRHCMLPLLEAGMRWDSNVGTSTMLNVRAEIAPAGVAS